MRIKIHLDSVVKKETFIFKRLNFYSLLGSRKKLLLLLKLDIKWALNKSIHVPSFLSGTWIETEAWHRGKKNVFLDRESG